MSKMVWCNLVAWVRMENPVLLEVPDDFTEDEQQQVSSILISQGSQDDYFIDPESWQDEAVEDILFEEVGEEDLCYVEYNVSRNADGEIEVEEGL